VCILQILGRYIFHRFNYLLVFTVAKIWFLTIQLNADLAVPFVNSDNGLSDNIDNLLFIVSHNYSSEFYTFCSDSGIIFYFRIYIMYYYDGTFIFKIIELAPNRWLAVTYWQPWLKCKSRQNAWVWNARNSRSCVLVVIGTWS